MGKCIYSHDDGAYCDKHDHGAVTVGCCGEGKCSDRKALTKADRIRVMSDEKLAEFIAKVQRAGAYGRAGAVFDYIDLTQDEVTLWLDWLKEEAT